MYESHARPRHAAIGLAGLLTSLLVGPLAGPLLALPSDPPHAYDLALTSHSFASPNTTSYYTRSAAGDFDGDLVRDVVQVHGANALVWFAPADFHALTDLGLTTLHDVEVKHTGSGYDDVLFVDDGGLKLAHVNPSTNSFGITTLEATHWVGAKLVRDPDPRGAATTALVGVAADGATLMLGATHANNWVPTTFVDTGAQVRDIAGLQWSESGGLEIAVATSAGARVYSATGTELADYPGASTENLIAVVRQSGQFDRLACATTVTSPNGQMMIVAKSPSTGPSMLDECMSLGSLGACAITCADMNDDGFEDLYFSNRLAQAVLVLPNQRSAAQPNATSFSAGAQSVIEYGSLTAAEPDNHATATVADLDNDGDLDLFITAQSSRRAHVRMNAQVAEHTLRPTVIAVHGDIGDTTYDLQLAPPGVGKPATANRLEVTTWYGAGSVVASTQALPTLATLQNQQLSFSGSALAANVDATLAYPFPAAYQPIGLLGVRVRYVERSASGALLKVWPSSVGILSNRTSEYDLICAFAGSGSGLPAQHASDPESGGGFVPRSSIGPFPPGGGTPH